MTLEVHHGDPGAVQLELEELQGVHHLNLQRPSQSAGVFNLNSSWARPLFLRYKNQNRFTSSAQEFSDVTLVCDDDKQVSAHKVSLDPIHRSSV